MRYRGVKRYHLDPHKPRRFTAEEVHRLKTTRIDYSDIPPLDDKCFSEAAESRDKQNTID